MMLNDVHYLFKLQQQVERSPHSYPMLKPRTESEQEPLAALRFYKVKLNIYPDQVEQLLQVMKAICEETRSL